MASEPNITHLTTPHIDTAYIKCQTAKLVDMVGGVHSAAAIAGKSPSMISKYQNPDNSHILCFATLIRLSRTTQDASLIKYANSLLGGTRPSAVLNFTSLMQMLGQIQKEGGEFMQVSLDALADQHISATDAQRMINELNDVLIIVQQTQKMLSSLRGGEHSQ